MRTTSETSGTMLNAPTFDSQESQKKTKIKGMRKQLKTSLKWVRKQPSSITSWPFFLSSFATPVIRMLGHLTLSQRSLTLSSFLLMLFFFFPLCFIYFQHSIFHLTYPIFCLSYSTVGSLQSVFDLLLHYTLLIDSFLFLLGPC